MALGFLRFYFCPTPFGRPRLLAFSHAPLVVFPVRSGKLHGKDPFRLRIGFDSKRQLRLVPLLAMRARARVAELADALDSGSSVRKDVGVQIPPLAP